MDTLKEDGLLSAELETRRLSVRESHAAVIEAIALINRRAVTLQYELQVQPKPPLPKIVESLYARTLFYIQSAVLLIDRGLDAPARVLLRASLDSLFELNAVARDANAAVQYLCDTESPKKLNSTREFAKVADPTICAEAVRISTFEWRPSTRATCDELQAREEHVAQTARTAGLEDMYNSAHPILSYSTHSTIRGLSYLEAADDDVLMGEPTVEGLTWLYMTTGKLMLEAIQTAAAKFGIKAEDFCAESRIKLKSFSGQIGAGGIGEACQAHDTNLATRESEEFGPPT